MQANIDTLQKHVTMVDDLYKQLLPVMRAIHAKYPETKREHLTQVDTSDGFCRVIDLVPNVQQYLMAALDYPEIKPPKPMVSYTAKTEEIFAQSRALLEHYKNDPMVADTGAIGLNDLLEGYLLEAYHDFDALHVPATQGVTPVAAARVADAPAPGKTPRAGK